MIPATVDSQPMTVNAKSALYVWQIMMPSDEPQLAALHECPSAPVMFHARRTRPLVQRRRIGMLRIKAARGDLRQIVKAKEANAGTVPARTIRKVQGSLKLSCLRW